MRLRFYVKFLLGVVAMMLATPGNAEKLYYRYPDENGRIVIGDKLPPPVVPRGYQVIRLDGSVVKTVPPQLESAEQQKKAEEAAIAAAAAERMRKWDESLLLRYSDLTDIEVAKERALNDLRVRIEILKSNLGILNKQVVRDQGAAAELERRGEPVPPQLLDNIRDNRSEVGATEEQIASRTRELEIVAENFERDKARFSELLREVEKRRQFERQRAGGR